MDRGERKKPVAPAVVALRERMEHWRRTRASKKSIPEDLWLEVAAVAREDGVYLVSRELRLDYDVLKRRAAIAPLKGAGPHAQFVELAVSPAAPPRTLEVEVVHADGDRMIMRLPADQFGELAALVRAFRSRER